MRKKSAFGGRFGYEGAELQMYLKKVREGGVIVSARIAMAAARGIVLTCDRTCGLSIWGCQC